MAGDWIKMRRALPACPKVAVICRLTKLDAYAVCGRLLALWSWADEHTNDGVAAGIGGDYLDDMVGKKGFADALAHIHVGWLEITDDGVIFPDYAKHNGSTGKTRAQAQRRQTRKRDKDHGPVTNRSRTNRDDRVTRGEERREEEIQPSVVPPNPPDGGSCATGGNPCPKVGETELEAAHLAVTAWSTADRGTTLLAHRNELRKFWDALDEIADMPPIPTPKGAIPAPAMVPKAIDAKRGAGTKFKSVAFAMGCVRSQLDEWTLAGVSEGETATETASQRRLRLAQEAEGDSP